MMGTKFWDIIVVRQDGEWVGFRTPFRSLKRTAAFFGFVMALSLVASFGWMLTRWKAHRLAQGLSSERLRASSLELQLNDFRNRSTTSSGLPLSTGENVSAQALQSFSLLPSLDAEKLESSLVELADETAEYDSSLQELSVKFEVVRRPPKEGAMRFYWIAMLHGPQGVLFLPPSMASRKGEPLLFHRGQPIDDVKTRRAVSAQFKLSDFVERAGAEPMFMTLLVYDNKGALLLRNRLDLFMRRASQKGSNQ